MGFGNLASTIIYELNFVDRDQSMRMNDNPASRHGKAVGSGMGRVEALILLKPPTFTEIADFR